MKQQVRISVVTLIASLLAAYINAPAVPSAPGSSRVPAATPTHTDSLLRPGDRVGAMVLRTGRDESGEPSIFNYCTPLITASDPATIIRDCTVPRMPYLFIGYGDFASLLDELDSTWKMETWELYFDGRRVDLAAFGTIDTNFDSNRLRQWNVTLENPTPGIHRLRYMIVKIDGSLEPTDATWMFTIGEGTPSPTTSASADARVYPALSAAINPGQHAYTSEKAHLDFCCTYRVCMVRIRNKPGR